ncbi:VTT domain-containing protein [Dyella sp. OK004]|uniref:DedA family protein n=1 Tax=Dyella sp. OK004 TaxID=1855292 RepID=UPI0015A5ABBC|nr:VTT domain-containing protein [Dyella sp. OK004]
MAAAAMMTLAADPVGQLMAWIAMHGLLGLAALAIAERLIPVLPSYAVLVAVGIGAAHGEWSLPEALAATCVGGMTGCLLFYSVGMMLGQHRAAALIDGSARLMRLPPASVQNIAHGLRANQHRYAFIAQLIPVVRLIAPGMASLLRLRPLGFIACTLPGLLLWNLLFIGIGHLAGRWADSVNASALALQTFVVLLACEIFIVATWRWLATRHPDPQRNSAP